MRLTQTSFLVLSFMSNGLTSYIRFAQSFMKNCNHVWSSTTKLTNTVSICLPLISQSFLNHRWRVQSERFNKDMEIPPNYNLALILSVKGLIGEVIVQYGCTIILSYSYPRTSFWNHLIGPQNDKIVNMKPLLHLPQYVWHTLKKQTNTEAKVSL